MIQQSGQNPQKEKRKSKNKESVIWKSKDTRTKKNIPALRDIVDLTLNSHKQRLFGIGTIIVLQILLRNLSKLNWWWERLHLFLGFPRPHMMTIVRGHKHAWDQIVHRNTQSDNCKETCRRKTCICCDRFFEGLPQLKGHCICYQIFSFFSSHREKMKKICQQERAKETKLMGRERKKSFLFNISFLRPPFLAFSKIIGYIFATHPKNNIIYFFFFIVSNNLI